MLWKLVSMFLQLGFAWLTLVVTVMTAILGLLTRLAWQAFKLSLRRAPTRARGSPPPASVPEVRAALPILHSPPPERQKRRHVPFHYS